MVFILCLAFQACAQKRAEPVDSPKVHFAVDSSLIATSVIDTVLSISFASPKGWQSLSSKALKSAENVAMSSVVESELENLKATPQLLYAWIHESSGSVITVSRFPGFDTGDSSATLREYEKYYRSTSPNADVRGAFFYSGFFKVHQLMVSGEQRVIFKIIFSSSRLRSPIQFDFVVPRTVYAQMIKTIESVAGSVEIHPINKSTY